MSFIFKITTTTSPQTFVIPCIAEGTFNATVDYGDGTGSQTVTAYNDSNLTHTFATAGRHTITIDGTFPNVRFFDDAASVLLVDEVVDLGDVGWVNFSRAFRGCSNLTAFNGGTVNTSNVYNMQEMFYNCSNLTVLDVSGFNTSSVTSMSYMFHTCSSLTSLDLSNFDTSSVNSMQQVFHTCLGLTSLDLSNFDTSSVTNSRYMFFNCPSLTSLDLSNFDTSSVTSMQAMFYNCTSLTSLDVSGFDTSSVTTMQQMFQNCTSLTTLNVSSFDTSSVTTMNQMFQSCTNLTSLNIKHFNVSSVTNGTRFLQIANNALTTTQYDELLEAWAVQDVQPNVAWHFGDAQYTVETIADWYSPRSVSSLSIINNKLVSIANSTATFGAAQQIDNLIIGNHYKIVGKAVVSNSAATVRIRVGSTYNLNDLPFNITATGSVTANTTFIATATTHYVGTIVTGHAANDTVTINAGITVKEITNYAEANAASQIEYSQENVFGSEEVANGDFIGTGNVTSWTLESSAINNDGVNVFNVTAGAGTNVLATQTITLTIGRVYQLSFERLTGTIGCSVSASSAGLPTLYSGVVGVENRTFVATASSATLLINSGSGSTTVIIDNISVKEITNAVEYKNIPQSARELYTLDGDTWTGSDVIVNGDFATDSDWNKGTGWTISNNSLNGASVNVAQAYQAGILTENTWYWVELNLNITNGYIKVKNSAALSTSGYYSFKYFNTGGVDLNIFGYSLFTGSIDNVSVKRLVEVPS